MAEREGKRIGLTSEQLAAKLVGRWHSGARLGVAPFDPGWSERAEPISAGDFVSDSAGERCPRFSHVRKANPRDLRSADPRRHRLIRRGIPYGPPLRPGVTEDDGVDRGLLFVAYQASLARQFEHIQRLWLDSPNFPRDGDGPAPLVGQAGNLREVQLRRQGGRVSAVGLEQFVSVTAGGYFFAPSLRALTHLAGGGVESDQQERGMAYEAARDLGEFILEQNPYSANGQLLVGFQAGSEFDERERQWNFNGQDRTVRRSIRVKYQYRRGDQLLTDHLLIGYEGQGGP
jgi:hypothetical protein